MEAAAVQGTTATVQGTAAVAQGTAAAGKRAELAKATLQGVSDNSTLAGGPNVREKVLEPAADARKVALGCRDKGEALNIPVHTAMRDERVEARALVTGSWKAKTGK